MLDEIEKLKRLPPMTQQVCGSCKFYISRPGYSTGGFCEAVGGTWASDAWKQCQGHLWWQPKLTLRQRIRTWLRRT